MLSDCVIDAEPSPKRDTPKSASFGHESGLPESRIFDGLMSRCTIPTECSSAVAARIGSKNLDGAPERKPPFAPKQLRQSAPLDELHREKRDAVSLTGVENFDDVCVVRESRDAGFAQASAGPLLISRIGGTRGKYLERDASPD